MRARTLIVRTAMALAFALPLAACGNNPQQPSDAVDDQSAESPYFGEPEDGSETASFESADVQNGDGSLEDEAQPELAENIGPAETGTVDEDTLMSSVSGEWAANPADCGSGGGTVVTVSRTELQRVGQQCEIENVIDGGDGSVSATLNCSATTGDLVASEIVRMAPQEDGTMLFNVIGSEDPLQALTRCEQ